MRHTSIAVLALVSACASAGSLSPAEETERLSQLRASLATVPIGSASAAVRDAMGFPYFRTINAEGETWSYPVGPTRLARMLFANGKLTTVSYEENAAVFVRQPRLLSEREEYARMRVETIRLGMTKAEVEEIAAPTRRMTPKELQALMAFTAANSGGTAKEAAEFGALSVDMWIYTIADVSTALTFMDGRVVMIAAGVDPTPAQAARLRTGLF